MQEEREGKLKDRSLFKNDGDKGPFKPGFKNQFGKDHSDLSAKTGEESADQTEHYGWTIQLIAQIFRRF